LRQGVPVSRALSASPASSTPRLAGQASRHQARSGGTIALAADRDGTGASGSPRRPEMRTSSAWAGRTVLRARGPLTRRRCLHQHERCGVWVHGQPRAQAQRPPRAGVRAEARPRKATHAAPGGSDAHLGAAHDAVVDRDDALLLAAGESLIASERPLGDARERALIRRDALLHRLVRPRPQLRIRRDRLRLHHVHRRSRGPVQVRARRIASGCAAHSPQAVVGEPRLTSSALRRFRPAL
jgi:hypothetical protein